jgi:hypothetical protein
VSILMTEDVAISCLLALIAFWAAPVLSSYIRTVKALKIDSKACFNNPGLSVFVQSIYLLRKLATASWSVST